MSMVLTKLADIQAEVEAIAKERKNTSQGYKFRGVEDVLNMIHVLLAKHRIVVFTHQAGEGKTEEHKTKSGGLLITRVYEYTFDFVAEDNSTITVGPIPGEGMDSGDKSSNKTMANAYKYCMFLTFSIPTQDLVTEPDNESPEVTGGNGHKTQKDKKSSEKLPEESSEDDPIKKLEKILNDPRIQADKKLKKEAETARTSMNNIKDKKSLQNFLNLWEKKLAGIKSVTPEEVAEAIRDEFFDPDDQEVSETFDNS